MSETRRESLIDAAAALLDQGGPAAVTLRDVGRAAGVSHNAPYKHFADKDDLLAAVAGRELRRLVEAGGSGADGAAPTPQGLAAAYLRWARRYPERFKLAFGRWAHSRPDFDAAAMAARRTMVEAVARAQAAGELPTGEPERLAMLILALAHGAADLAIAGQLTPTRWGHADPETLVAQLFAWLRAGASRGPGE